RRPRHHGPRPHALGLDPGPARQLPAVPERQPPRDVGRPADLRSGLAQVPRWGRSRRPVGHLLNRRPTAGPRRDYGVMSVSVTSSGRTWIECDVRVVPVLVAITITPPGAMLVSYAIPSAAVTVADELGRLLVPAL